MITNAIREGGRKLFTPHIHQWYRPICLSNTNTGSMFWTVEIGLTDRCLQDLGDIQKMYSEFALNKNVSKDDTVLSLDWDGYKITDGDEMYHTAWTNVQGTYTITSPVNGRLEYLANDTDIIDEDQVLVVLSTTEESLVAAIQLLVHEDEYEKLKYSMPPGTFSKVDGLR
jgi:hypothetical protein